MENSFWGTVGAYACLAGIVLAFAAPIIISIYYYTKKRSNTRKKADAEKQSIISGGGLMAPAVVVSARRIEGSKYDHTIDFEVDVQTENHSPFRAGFRDVIYLRSYTAVGGELVDQVGRKVWVVYDPNNLSRVALDHYDGAHQEFVLNDRRGEFNKLTEGNEDLKKRGEPAEAVITRVDDLDLPYPLKKGRAMHLYFDVTPKAGAVFQAEGDFMFGDSAIQKYSVGKKVYVRFDPLDQKRAVLDSERNKSLR